MNRNPVAKMLHKIFIGTLVMLAGFLSGCSDHKKTTTPGTALETGRDFIRASLDGNFEEAIPHILPDSQNLQLFESYKQYYRRLPEDKKQNYRKASYTINSYSDLDDSTTVINYSNTYMNKPMEIKMVKDNKVWKVDFKYTYSGSATAE
ncbi:MAG: hypothetical protein ABIP80_03270 [Ferruginibacter sp.]